MYRRTEIQFNPYRGARNPRRVRESAGEEWRQALNSQDERVYGSLGLPIPTQISRAIGEFAGGIDLHPGVTGTAPIIRHTIRELEGLHVLPFMDQGSMDRKMMRYDDALMRTVDEAYNVAHGLRPGTTYVQIHGYDLPFWNDHTLTRTAIFNTLTLNANRGDTINYENLVTLDRNTQRQLRGVDRLTGRVLIIPIEAVVNDERIIYRQYITDLTGDIAPYVRNPDEYMFGFKYILFEGASRMYYSIWDIAIPSRFIRSHVDTGTGSHSTILVANEYTPGFTLAYDQRHEDMVKSNLTHIYSVIRNSERTTASSYLNQMLDECLRDLGGDNGLVSSQLDTFYFNHRTRRWFETFGALNP